jgi:hypothetical protein
MPYDRENYFPAARGADGTVAKTRKPPAQSAQAPPVMSGCASERTLSVATGPK